MGSSLEPYTMLRQADRLQNGMYDSAWDLVDINKHGMDV